MRKTAEQVLAERARILASNGDRATRTVRVRAVAFEAGGKRFALPATRLREVLPARPVVPLPGLRPWLPGLIQLRGELVSTVSLPAWFFGARAAPPRFHLIAERGSRLLALEADVVHGFVDVHEDELTGQFELDGARPLLGVTSSLLFVLDVDLLFQHPDLRVDDAAPRPAGESR